MKYTQSDSITLVGTIDNLKFTAVYSIDWEHGTHEKALVSVHASIPRYACVDGCWDLYEMHEMGDDPLTIVPNFIKRELVEAGSDYGELAGHLAWYTVVLMNKIGSDGLNVLDDLYCDGFSSVRAFYESSTEASS